MTPEQIREKAQEAAEKLYLQRYGKQEWLGNGERDSNAFQFTVDTIADALTEAFKKGVEHGTDETNARRDEDDQHARWEAMERGGL